VERQFEWYALNAGWEVADRYAKGVEATARLIGQHPRLGPRAGFTHPRLRAWRFFVSSGPSTMFYEVVGEDVVLRRIMHGQRDLPRRLLKPPNLT